MTARALIETALPTTNTTFGFMGSLLNQARPSVADAAWDYASEQLLRLSQGAATEEDVRQYLDSRHGRILVDEMSFHTRVPTEGAQPTVEELKVAIDATLEAPWVARTFRKFIAAGNQAAQFGQ